MLRLWWVRKTLFSSRVLQFFYNLEVYMRRTINNLLYFILITLVTASASFVSAQRPYRVSDGQVQYLLNRIEQRTDAYKRQMNTALDRSRLNNTDAEDMLMNYITDFENSTDALKQKFEARESVDGDVEDVLSRAAYINQFMQQNRLGAGAERSWNFIRTDLNTLARYYSVSWNWTNPTAPPTAKVPYRVSDANVQSLLARIETKSDTFKRTVNRSLDRSRLNETNSENSINDFITQFENATDNLKQRFDSRQSVAADVENVLMKANAIEGFLRDYRLNRNVQNQWSSLKVDLNTLANYYSVSWDWNRTYPTTPTTPTGRLPYTVADAQVQTLLTRIETRTDAFNREMQSALDRSVLDNTRSESSVLSYISEFENATDRLKQNFDARRSTSNDVSEVLNRASFIDNFMRDYRFDVRAERSWSMLKTDLDMLSNYYSVGWNWNRQYESPTRFDQMITGTYRLNIGESDDVSAVVERASNAYYAGAQRERLQRNLELRLQSPNMLAIEKRGTNVTIASSVSPQITFEADGVARTETMPNGRRTVNVTARTNYDGVALSYEGDRVNDFYVNFMPVGNDKLRVIRRVYLENRNETVTVASVYDKVNQSAQWSWSITVRRSAIIRIRTTPSLSFRTARSWSRF